MRLPLVLGILALATGAVWVWPTPQEQTVTEDASAVLGKEAQPDQVASLRVVGWDEALSVPQILEVKKAGGVWTIPSQFDFPADGNTKVSKAAAGFLGVRRGRPVTSDEKQFEKLGVVDPLETAAQSGKGQGKRVTMTDGTGATLVDLIIGKYVEGASGGLYYVREAGGKAVYTAKVDPWELSTKFVDYVETDPFRIAKDDVRALSIADYTVDEAKGEIGLRAETGFARPAGAQDWAATAKTTVPDGKRVAKTAIDNLVNEVNGIRLVGVRPFSTQELQGAGFFATDKTLYGKEGSISVTTKDGLRYLMFFGVTAVEPSAEKPKPEDANKLVDPPKGSNRYMAVFVQYVAEADETKGAKPADTPAPAKKPLSGEERAKKAQARFTKFFYTISDESFKKLRPSLDTLFEAKPAEPQAGKTGKTNSQWLEEHGKQPGVLSTPSGLQYEVLTAGPADGKLPTDTDQVEVRYKGTLVDGEEFDSTKGDATASFGVTGVIKGWTEALKLMRPGDKWKLTIPPAIAYGEAGSPPKIPANSILQFEVELVKIK